MKNSVSCKKTPQLLDRFPDAAIVFDRQGNVTYMNRAAVELFGLKRPRTGTHYSSLFPPEIDMKDLVSSLPRHRTIEKEVTIVLKGNSRVPLLARFARISSPGANIMVFLERVPGKRSQQHMRIDRLASLGELAAGVAHEIRNPLAGIGTSAQVLRSRFERDDERVRFADVILDEVERLEKIIENMLLFARPKQPQLVKHDMRDSVRRILNLVSEQVEKQHVRVETASEPDLPLIYVDPGQMSQVLLNLVLNAVHAMPSGGQLRLELKTVTKKVVVSAGRRKTDARPGSGSRSMEFVRLIVSDTGIGIPKQNLSKLFTPFFTTKSAGTGLGLSISQAIIREHGGSISVSSAEGHGTKVVIDIPVEKRYGERR